MYNLDSGKVRDLCKRNAAGLSIICMCERVCVCVFLSAMAIATMHTTWDTICGRKISLNWQPFPWWQQTFGQWEVLAVFFKALEITTKITIFTNGIHNGIRMRGNSWDSDFGPAEGYRFWNIWGMQTRFNRGEMSHDSGSDCRPHAHQSVIKRKQLLNKMTDILEESGNVFLSYLNLFELTTIITDEMWDQKFIQIRCLHVRWVNDNVKNRT